MRWKERIFILIAALISVGTIALILSVQPHGATDAAKPEATTAIRQDEPLVTYLDPFIGKADAAKTIVVYANYACPFCKSLEGDLKTLVANHPNVRVVWKDLPNEVPGAELAAEAGHCAMAQGKFWEYHDRLFEDTNWSDANLALIANSLGLNLDTFNGCLQNHDAKSVIDASVNEGTALGIDATPTLFVGKSRYVGQLSYDRLEAIIN